MNALIPVYYADGSLYAWASTQRIARLQSAGLVASVVRRRKGCLCRVILSLRSAESRPKSATSVGGTRYSFRERLEGGPTWELKCLGNNHDGKTYAPPEMRAAFRRVVEDCLIT